MSRFLRSVIVTTATFGAPSLSPIMMLVPSEVGQLIIWGVTNTKLTPSCFVALTTNSFDPEKFVVVVHFIMS